MKNLLKTMTLIGGLFVAYKAGEVNMALKCGAKKAEEILKDMDDQIRQAKENKENEKSTEETKEEETEEDED